MPISPGSKVTWTISVFASNWSPSSAKEPTTEEAEGIDSSSSDRPQVPAPTSFLLFRSATTGQTSCNVSCHHTITRATQPGTGQAVATVGGLKLLLAAAMANKSPASATVVTAN
eukprot:CAMPEP_0169322830 /NCGR_PEP_ID=MMETSP1017-20121227/9628_1 /TAXON_ID=342587 /ORGANISM="Karlodinium micrum, Strain CCMP2283" /LENGTH=113 /DNA_ID=CAMNT_0009417397 /DNA_START=136 /DNA_END=477 /DNA_ORIENTATION=+